MSFSAFLFVLNMAAAGPISSDTTIGCGTDALQFAGGCRSFDWFQINLAASDADLEAVAWAPATEEGVTQVILLEVEDDRQRIVLVSGERATGSSENRGGWKVQAKSENRWSVNDDGEPVMRSESFYREGLPLVSAGWTETTYWSGGYESCDQDGECTSVYYDSAIECSTMADIAAFGAYTACGLGVGAFGLNASMRAGALATLLTVETGPGSLAAGGTVFVTGMGATAWVIDSYCPRVEELTATLVEDLLDETDFCDGGSDAGGPGVDPGGVDIVPYGEEGCEESVSTETLEFDFTKDGWHCTVTYEAAVTTHEDCSTSAVRTSDYSSVCMPA